MKWLRKWGYLILLTVVGLFYFSYVDGWKVYAEALAPVAEWYDEQSDKSEVLATVNGWLADVMEQGVALAGKLGVSDLPDWLQGEENHGQTENGDDAVTGEVEIGEEGNVGQEGFGDNVGDTIQSNPGGEDVEQTENGGTPEKPAQSGTDDGVKADGQVGNIGSGTHITIGGAESGIEVGFGDGTEDEPDYRSVKDLYFADAVFIGDSRTVGMFEYGGLEEITTFYASKGLSVYDIFDKKIVEVPGQKKKITVEEALQQNSFSKIYLMLGLNEMGTGTTETFLTKYGEVLAHLQELQPDAIIYVQAIMKLTTERSGKGDQFHNEGIEERNLGLSQFADNEKIFFLDVNPLICDETGGMITEYTYDGIHLKAKYIEIWKDYLKSHAIIP